jgi:hypothetical protein
MESACLSPRAIYYTAPWVCRARTAACGGLSAPSRPRPADIADKRAASRRSTPRSLGRRISLLSLSLHTYGGLESAGARSLAMRRMVSSSYAPRLARARRHACSGRRYGCPRTRQQRISPARRQSVSHLMYIFAQSTRSGQIASSVLDRYRCINLLAVDTQGTKDDSLKQQPQAVAPSLAGISWGSMGAKGGRGLAGCACSLAARRSLPFSLSRSRHLSAGKNTARAPTISDCPVRQGRRARLPCLTSF